MLILDAVVNVSESRIKLPFYHRGHLSLKSETLVSACLIPESDVSQSARMTEMIVSPIQFHSWSHLWRIVAVFREQQGVVHKLLSLVRKANLNVLMEESSSVENRDLHEIELIVDASSAHSQEGREAEIFRELERWIVAMCIDELAVESGRPRLKIRRMKGLCNAAKRFQSYTNGRSWPDPIIERTIIRRGYLELPDDISRLLSQRKPVRALLVSDTKERMLRVFFPRANEHFTYLRVKHLDSLGALEKITGELAKAFDIFTSLTRIKAQGDQNELELLLFSREFPDKHQETTRREIIDNLLAQPRLTALSLRLSYPESVGLLSSVGSEPKGGHEVKFSSREGLPEARPEFFELSTAEIIKRKIQEYTEWAKRSPSYDQEYQELKERLSILKKIALEDDREESLDRLIFVSYDFNRRDLLGIVKSTLLEARCGVMTGRDPSEKPVFRDVIIDRIFNCQAFIGIWTPRPPGVSPWLLWELGVAQAFKLPIGLLIDERVPQDVWFPINPEKNHVVFRKSDFREKAKGLISSLAGELARTRKLLR